MDAMAKGMSVTLWDKQEMADSKTHRGTTPPKRNIKDVVQHVARTQRGPADAK